jgi:glutathione S-transferase
MSALPILYSFRRCPYAMRARMAIIYAKIPINLREVALRNKPAELLVASAKATVPVLVLPDGGVIDESINIMRWALAQFDPDNWLGREDKALIAINDGQFKNALDRYKYPQRYEIDDVAPYQETGRQFLAKIEAQFANQKFLAGHNIGFTDIAIFPFVRQFAATDEAWFKMQMWANVTKWRAQISASDLFENAMQRFPVWQSQEESI